MGLVLGLILAVLTIAVCSLLMLGISMSDDPASAAASKHTVLIMFVVGMGISVLLVVSHYHPPHLMLW